MFKCPNCWENPCICGNEYQTWSDEKIRNQIKMLKNVLKHRHSAQRSSVAELNDVNKLKL